MFPKYYNNNILSTYLPNQKVATCQISSVKTKSMRQTSFSKFNNHIWKVQVKWIITVYNQYGAFSSHHNYRDGDKFFFSRILSDQEYQLTEPWWVDENSWWSS